MYGVTQPQHQYIMRGIGVLKAALSQLHKRHLNFLFIFVRIINDYGFGELVVPVEDKQFQDIPSKNSEKDVVVDVLEVESVVGVESGGVDGVSAAGLRFGLVLHQIFEEPLDLFPLFVPKHQRHPACTRQSFYYLVHEGLVRKRYVCDIPRAVHP